MSLRSPRRGRGYRRVCWHDPVVLLGYPHATVLWRELLKGVWDGYEHGYISWMLRVLWKLHHVAINAVHCASGIVVSNRWLWKLEWVLPCLFANVIANKPGWGVRFISLPLPPSWLVDGGVDYEMWNLCYRKSHINWCFTTRGILYLLLLRVSKRHLCSRD